ncbi:uncharacterized protein LOC141522195 isoform X3 [Macrotis lagotis]|uniref:uncharacterized protein LOC141522195 isoform X3 n=1 Tax=Macrotis lagotis TaxID=92651 RepID=UPI003D68847F
MFFSSPDPLMGPGFYPSSSVTHMASALKLIEMEEKNLKKEENKDIEGTKGNSGLQIKRTKDKLSIAVLETSSNSDENFDKVSTWQLSLLMKPDRCVGTTYFQEKMSKKKKMTNKLKESNEAFEEGIFINKSLIPESFSRSREIDLGKKQWKKTKNLEETCKLVLEELKEIYGKMKGSDLEKKNVTLEEDTVIDEALIVEILLRPREKILEKPLLERTKNLEVTNLLEAIKEIEATMGKSDSELAEDEKIQQKEGKKDIEGTKKNSELQMIKAPKILLKSKIFPAELIEMEEKQKRRKQRH